VKGFIYQIVSRATGRRYIGSTTRSPTLRWQEHKTQLRAGKHFNSRLQKAFLKYGEDNFLFSVIERTDSVHGLEESYLGTTTCELYNFAYDASAPMHGRKHTQESIAKMKANRKPLTQAVRKRLGEAARARSSGRKASVETKRKMARAHAGQRRTPDQCTNIKEAVRAFKACAIERFELATRLCISYYTCITDVTADGFSPSAVSHALAGRTKSSGGFGWRYATDG
jgi:group I intron endonuclease